MSPTGTPVATAIYFVAETDFKIYFVTKARTRKLQNVLQHSKASLLTFDEDELISTEIMGKVEVVEDTLECAKAMEKFQSLVENRRKGFVPPIAQIEAGKYVACKISPNEVCFRKFAKSKMQAPVEVVFNPGKK